jgi:hypothetical protein
VQVRTGAPSFHKDRGLSFGEGVMDAEGMRLNGSGGRAAPLAHGRQLVTSGEKD